jgi:hypothetical protein
VHNTLAQSGPFSRVGSLKLYSGSIALHCGIVVCIRHGIGFLHSLLPLSVCSVVLLHFYENKPANGKSLRMDGWMLPSCTSIYLYILFFII